METPGEYIKLQPKRYPARAIRETAEGRYWRKFATPVVHKEFGAVSDIDFCPQAPHLFAVTAGVRVLVYSPRTAAPVRQFTRFQDTAYSGKFRDDGKLLVAGGEQGVVQLMDAASRSVLRQFKGHRRAVHCTRFSPDRLKVLSASDDVTVRLWDITEGAQVCRLDGHGDYVRAAEVRPGDDSMWASGAYDHTVRLWDVRSRECTLNVDHGAPVEALAWLPGGAILASAGGNAVCLWDVLGGGRLLKRLANHQKTVSSLCLVPGAGPDSNTGPRLLSGSLDGHVKVFELDTFKVTHAMRFPAPVTAVGAAPGASTLAVGMADGTLCIKPRIRVPKPGELPPAAPRGRSAPPERPGGAQRLTAGNFRFFIRGQSEKAGEDDFRVAAQRRARLSSFDRLLRRFRHREALTAALQGGRPETVAAVLDELSRRGALGAAIAGRDADALLPLVNFLARHVADPRHTRTLGQVAARVLEVYAPVLGQSAEVDAAVRKLREGVLREVRVQEDLCVVQGILEPLLAASAAQG
ncbi:unnamed protein product [Pedinophyceae sp. YPF-701]|nr:unnamed protein product [Pedinophyceae sp. YPF-701]